MNIPEVMKHSYEQLTLLSNAARRSRAESILKLSHAIVAGTAGSQDWWKEVQGRLIEELKTGL